MPNDNAQHLIAMLKRVFINKGDQDCLKSNETSSVSICKEVDGQPCGDICEGHTAMCVDQTSLV